MVVVASSQHDGESRFAHLLQPIRDLSTNWNIDLASELEDYLSEVWLLTYSAFSTMLNIFLCVYTFTMKCAGSILPGYKEDVSVNELMIIVNYCCSCWTHRTLNWRILLLLLLLFLSVIDALYIYCQKAPPCYFSSSCYKHNNRLFSNPSSFAGNDVTWIKWTNSAFCKVMQWHFSCGEQIHNHLCQISLGFI